MSTGAERSHCGSIRYRFYLGAQAVAGLRCGFQGAIAIVQSGDRGAGAVGVAQHPGCGFWVYRWVKLWPQNSGFWGRSSTDGKNLNQKPEFYACPNPLRQGAFAGHDADVFAGAPGG